MGFPTSRAGLEAAGYRFDRVGTCRGDQCNAELHWWWTPRRKRIPLNPDCTPHHATCLDVEEFRGKKPKAP